MMVYKETDMGALVQRARQRDEAAVIELIRHCSSRIVAGIEIAGVPRYGSEFDDAQNQALFEIWKQFPSLKSDQATCAWMHGVARRITASRIIDPAVRHRRRAERLRSVQTSDSTVLAGPAKQVADRDLLGRVLERLSPEHREVLVLRFLEGMSEQETADAIGVSVKTVSSRTSRAKRAAMDLVNDLEEVVS